MGEGGRGNFIQVRAALKDAVMESFGRLAISMTSSSWKAPGAGGNQPAEETSRIWGSRDLPVVVGDGGSGVFAFSNVVLLSDGERARLDS
jgi:hypothetical protein